MQRLLFALLTLLALASICAIAWSVYIYIPHQSEARSEVYFFSEKNLEAVIDGAYCTIQEKEDFRNGICKLDERGIGGDNECCVSRDILNIHRVIQMLGLLMIPFTILSVLYLPLYFLYLFKKRRRVFKKTSQPKTLKQSGKMSYNKTILALIILAGFCVLLMFLVNALGPVPTADYVPGEITRYYHNHSNPEDAGKPLAQIAGAMIAAYQLLGSGSGFLIYQATNILFYAVLWPALMVYLTCWAFGPLSRRPRGST